jgi:outer membrane receptor protein involved in Fe transport
VVFSGATRDPGGVQDAGGAFGGLDAPLSDGVDLSAGLRVDGWRQTPSEGTDGEQRGAAALSPRAGLAWRRGNGVTLRAAGYGAFRAPTLNELYRQFRVGNVSTLANPDLEEERLWGAEAGAGWQGELGGDATLALDGTFYWNRLDDAVINATVSVTPNLITRRRENLGAATARGIELGARLDVRRDWSVRVAWAWLDSFIREAVEGSDAGGTVGNRLPQVPDYRAHATLGWRNDPGWAASLWVAATGEQFEDDLNELRLAPAVTVGGALEVPVIDAARLTVRAENLFDEQVEVRRGPVLVYGAPRLLYAGLTLSWPD